MDQHFMNALANSYVFWLALIFGLLMLYILPSLIGAVRGVEGLGWIIVINLLPTGIGWIAALFLALTQPSRHPRAPTPVPAAAGNPEHRWPPVPPASNLDHPVPACATVISGARYKVIASASARPASTRLRRTDPGTRSPRR